MNNLQHYPNESLLGSRESLNKTDRIEKYLGRTILRNENTCCFKKSFTTLKVYRNLYRGHTQRFELSKTKKDAFTSSKTVHPLITLEKCASNSTPVSQVGG